MARAGVINEEGVDPRALRPGKERVGGVTRTITREALQKSVAENVTHSNPWEEIVKGPPHGTSVRLTSPPPPPPPRQWRING